MEEEKEQNYNKDEKTRGGKWQKQPPAPKKRGRGKFFAIGCGALAALVVFIAIIAIAASSGNNGTAPSKTANSATTPTTQATQAAGHWTTTHTFTGNGSKHTATFNAPSDWKIVWKCDPASFAVAYNVIIEVDNASDSSPLDLPVNTTCKAGNTTDSSEEHQGGSVYLNVTSEGDWTIQVQELK